MMESWWETNLNKPMNLAIERLKLGIEDMELTIAFWEYLDRHAP